MAWLNANLEEELQKNQSYSLWIDQIKLILAASGNSEMELKKRIFSKQNKYSNLPFKLSPEDLACVHSITQIKKLCIKYHLRFLPASFYKAGLPNEALLKVKHFENKYQVRINEFYIIAPASAFKLKDIHSDPLLLAKIDDDRYVFIHKWGRDLSKLRAYMSYPLRNIYSFFTSVWLPAATIGFSIPFSWLNILRENEFQFRIWLTLHFFIAIFFFSIFLFSTSKINFSENSWKSPHFND